MPVPSPVFPAKAKLASAIRPTVFRAALYTKAGTWPPLVPDISIALIVVPPGPLMATAWVAASPL